MCGGEGRELFGLLDGQLGMYEKIGRGKKLTMPYGYVS
jgi:hypothetical protein